MICITITARTNKEALKDIERSCLIADFIELRMDLIKGGVLPELISAARSGSASVKIIVTCRKREEAAPAGKAVVIKNTKNQKIALLKEAIKLGADFIDIELAEGNVAIRELKTFCTKQGGFTKIIISYHDVKKTPSLTKLKEVFNKCAKAKPAIVKIVTLAKAPEDNLRVLSLIPYARKHSQEIIALCMGAPGRLSRAVAPIMGNYLSFAALDKKSQSAPGQFTVGDMKQILKLLKGENAAPPLTISPTDTLQNYILLGNPVQQSLSPLMHNAALKEMKMAGNYTAFCVRNLGGALRGMRDMNIRGASITIPYKTEAMEYLDDVDEHSLKIGAVNTIINENGRLKGCNTDWLGLILTLKEAMTIKDKTFVIIGAGGTARAVAYGILKEGGFPIITNRTPEKGKILSGKFDCPFYPLSEIGKINADCLINTTPVGMYPHKNKSPVESSVLTGYKYVMDVIYNPLKTKLLTDAEKQGCHIFSGLDMFVHQGAEQLQLWTGKEPPLMLMKKVVWERLTKIE
ncbi:MAG: shikimate dehydrogenase [Smithellaceae bacterium]|jgi:shikimate dehydrogenase/3-dehydroquinate dehydratase type I